MLFTGVLEAFESPDDHEFATYPYTLLNETWTTSDEVAIETVRGWKVMSGLEK